MTRLLAWLFVTMVITTVIAIFAGCGGSSRGPTTGPTAPVGTTGPTSPSGPTYTISGVITEYRGGPLNGVAVNAYAAVPSGDAQTTTSTNPQGSYSLSSPLVGRVLLAMYKSGYVDGFKILNVSAQNSVQNFVMDRDLQPMNRSGDVVAGTISGDELLAGDDVFFGGFVCPHGLSVGQLGLHPWSAGRSAAPLG
jgi:hypothetical protein